MKPTVRHMIFCAVVIFGWMSCNKKVRQEDLVQSALVLKVDQWREKKMHECIAKAYADAEKYVDSMMLATSLPSKMDTIPKPPKPLKPTKPFIKTKPDSLGSEELR